MKQRTIMGLIVFCRAPLFLIFSLIVILILSWLHIIPPVEVFGEKLRLLLSDYGSVIVGPVSFLENLAIVNFVFPGSIIILTTMALTAGDIVKATWTFLLIWSGSLIGLTCSYLLGKILLGGVSKKALRVKNKSIVWQAMLTFWHPQFASMMCFSLGTNNISLRSAVAPLVGINFTWNMFWGVLTYNIGSIFKDAVTIKFLLFTALLLWLAGRSYLWYKTSMN